MKPLIVFVLFLASASPIAAQPRDAAAAQVHRGNVKMTIGTALVAAAAIVLPITAADTKWSGPAVKTGMGMLAVGGGFMVWGARDRYKAVHPETRITLYSGPATGVQIRRSW